MIINPYAFTTVAAGQPPNGIGAGANLTFWYDGDGSVHYEGNEDNDPLANVDGDSVVRADSANSIARVLAAIGSTSSREIPLSGHSANGMYILNIAGSGSPQPYTKPGAGASPTVVSTVGTLFTNANAVIIMAINVVDAVTDQGAAYLNGILMGEENGYLGMYVYKSGGNAVFQSYNYVGSDTVVTETEALSTWAVITLKHSGGQLRIRKNGGSYTSVASGNTQVTTGALKAFYKLEAYCAQFATYNAAITDANILEVERWMGAKVGITI